MTATSNSTKQQNKKSVNKKPLLPLFTAWLFTLIGGYLSAYAYVLLDGVFANMQTGNIIKCAIFAIEGKPFGYLLLSIAAFVFGVAVAAALGKVKAGNFISIITEALAIGVCVILAGNGEDNKLALNLIISFSCALQYEFFRMVGESGFTSVMCTNNLRLAVQNLTLGAIERNKSKLFEGVYFLSFMLLFVSGVVVGTLLSDAIGYIAVSIVWIPLAVILVLQIIDGQKRTKKFSD